MPTKRKAIPTSTLVAVLHESGYMCANPTCRMVITLDMHHLEYVSEGGPNDATNLLPLCPNCHALHHRGSIPATSLRTWKMLLVTLNEGFDRKSVSILLMLDRLSAVQVSGDGLLECAPLIASGLVEVNDRIKADVSSVYRTLLGDGEVVGYFVRLSDKGRLFVGAWKNGDQQAAVRSTSQTAP